MCRHFSCLGYIREKNIFSGGASPLRLVRDVCTKSVGTGALDGPQKNNYLSQVFGNTAMFAPKPRPLGEVAA